MGSLLEVGTGFHPDLTGRENIFLNGAILGMRRTEIARKFDEIVAFAEVERFLDTQVKHYSSGMYLRLAFAVSAHLEPDILLVDEVLAVGDVEFQRKCLDAQFLVAGRVRQRLFLRAHPSRLELGAGPERITGRGPWLNRSRERRGRRELDERSCLTSRWAPYFTPTHNAADGPVALQPCTRSARD